MCVVSYMELLYGMYNILYGMYNIDSALNLKIIRNQENVGKIMSFKSGVKVDTTLFQVNCSNITPTRAPFQ